jgi:hypothetical protein
LVIGLPGRGGQQLTDARGALNCINSVDPFG